MPDDPLARFSVVTRDWFAGTFAAPTPAQADAWAAYVGLGRSDPVLLGIDDEAKDRQMEHIMSRVMEVDGSTEKLDPDVERDLRIVIHGWLALTFEVCRQRILHPDSDADQLSHACAHSLLDAIVRVHNIPETLTKSLAPDQR